MGLVMTGIVFRFLLFAYLASAVLDFYAIFLSISFVSFQVEQTNWTICILPTLGPKQSGSRQT
jgi:hypothetical protein